MEGTFYSRKEGAENISLSTNYPSNKEKITIAEHVIETAYLCSLEFIIPPNISQHKAGSGQHERQQGERD